MDSERIRQGMRDGTITQEGMKLASRRWKQAETQKRSATEKLKKLQAEVERLRNIEAQAINLSRAFATGSAWQKERAVKDLVERLAHQLERKKENG